MSALTLPQRLALVKFLAERLDKLRKGDLVPQAQGDMDSGERLSVKFGGKRVAWVSMPQPSDKAAYVSNAARLLSWAQVNYPDRVEKVPVIAISQADLIALLEASHPEAVRYESRVDPQWAADITGALKGGGSYVTSAGEKLTEVPGITVPEADAAVPRVTLEDDAADTISAAWLAGDIPADEILALPPPARPVPGKLGELLSEIPLWDVTAFLAWRTGRADMTPDTLTTDEGRYAAGYLGWKLREAAGDGEAAGAAVRAEWAARGEDAPGAKAGGAQ